MPSGYFLQMMADVKLQSIMKFRPWPLVFLAFVQLVVPILELFVHSRVKEFGMRTSWEYLGILQAREILAFYVGFYLLLCSAPLNLDRVL
jgi:hypothetical protein